MDLRDVSLLSVDMRWVLACTRFPCYGSETQCGEPEIRRILERDRERNSGSKPHCNLLNLAWFRI